MRIGIVVSVLLACAWTSASAGAKPPAGDEISLFNGRNFSGWTFYLEEKGINAGGKAKISDFASVKPGGIIQIDPKGPIGALMTKKDYLNYRLRLEWRWTDPAGRHLSGVFLRIRPPFVYDLVHGEGAHTYILEVQPPGTGDLYVTGYSETMLKTDPKFSYEPFGELKNSPGRPNWRMHKRFKDAEKPAGEWNALDVTVSGKTISVRVNGELVNEGTNLVDLPGRIGLEVQVGGVQYRNIRLTSLDR